MSGRSVIAFFNLHRPLSGRAYGRIGVSLLLIKFAVDCFIAWVFGHTWSPVVYLRPSTSFGLLAIPEGELSYYLAMVCAAAPFTAMGLAATCRRLRTVRMHALLTLLFFVPILNLFLFTALCVAPERSETSEGQAVPVLDDPTPAVGARAVLIPNYGRVEKPAPRGSFLLAAFAPVLPALLFTVLSTHVLANYGWGLFVGAPFAVSFTAGILCGRLTSRKGPIFLAGMLSLVFWLAALIALQVEGVACLVMAAPIVLAMGGLGALFGVAVNSAMGDLFDAKRTLLMLLLVPSLMSLEKWSQAEAPLFAVTTWVDVDAPREAVWNNVIHFPQLAAPQEWVFWTGVAYPTSATITGTGTGATRQCRFSTGTFEEPITVWDEPRLLRFDVTKNPPPLREWNPFGRVDAPHLDGFFVSQQGQFHLVALSDGRTRLEGTTWYQHHMWPASYWEVWSDYVIHRIHGRVLRHIKVLAEEDDPRYLARGRN